MIAGTSQKLYICPGEGHPISRSVHLSRLAAFYPVCRDCPLRADTGHLPGQIVERLQQTERRVQRRSLYTAEGVRGVYINDLTRKKAGRIATALADLLWEDAPLVGLTETSRRSNRRNRPAVVVGHDERPSAPDIVTGVASALRRMGCQVIDISLTSTPCFRFAVDHLQAAAGIFVTGNGCQPSWTGMDFVLRGAVPLGDGQVLTAEASETAPSKISLPKSGLSLDLLEERSQRPISRATRHAGPHRTFQVSIPYEAGLWKHFHALRPLTVVSACPTRLARQTLERIFEMLPCTLIALDIPNRVRNPVDPADADIERLSQTVKESRAHLGVLIDDDGQRCGFVDERGELISSRDLTGLLAELMLDEHPAAAIVVESAAEDSLRSRIEKAGGTCLASGPAPARMAQSMSDKNAIFGGGDSGRFWFRESFATCDAVLTLAKVLDLLSRSDSSFSEVADTGRPENDCVHDSEQRIDVQEI